MVGASQFTFQYGQIYYKIILRHRSQGVKNLHSNMVRFIIMYIKPNTTYGGQFTFQYGQIYYTSNTKLYNKHSAIYIPIWLDLLSGIRDDEFLAAH